MRSLSLLQRGFARALVGLFSTVTLASLVACGSAGDPGSAQYELGSAIISVTLQDISQIKTNEPSTFTIELENTSDETVMFQLGTHDFWLLDENDAIVWTSAAFRGGGSPPEITLGPRESVNFSRTWETAGGRWSSSRPWWLQSGGASNRPAAPKQSPLERSAVLPGLQPSSSLGSSVRTRIFCTSNRLRINHGQQFVAFGDPLEVGHCEARCSLVSIEPVEA